MTLTILAAVLAIAVLPLMLVRAWRSTRRVVFQGPAIAITRGLEDLGKRTNTRYCWFQARDQNATFLAELTPESFEKIRLQAGPADITVVQYILGRPEVESVRWQGERQSEATATPGGEVLWVGLTYFFAALGMLVFATAHHGETYASAAFYSSALLLALTGFSINTMLNKKHKISEITARIAGIKLGTGMIPLLVMLSIALALTYVCFTWVGLFTFFPGIHAAFASGSICSILLNSRQST
jgi:hypothetical protein